MKMRLRADLTLLAVAALWGSAFAAQRAAAQFGSVYLFNGARFLLAALMLLPFSLRHSWKRDQVLWTVVAGVVLFAASALQQFGLLTTTAGNAGFLTSLYVVIVPLIMFLAWRETLHVLALCAVLIACIGAFLLSATAAWTVNPGDALELVGAAFWAMHVVLLGKFASAYDPVAFSAGQLLVGGALNLATSGLFETHPWPLPAPLWGAILYTAVASLGIGYTLQIWGQKHTPPTDAALILSLESVFALLAGRLLLGERLTGIQTIGCGLIFGAVALSQVVGWSRIQQLKPDRRPASADSDV